MKLSGTQIVWIIATTEIVAMIGLKISPVIQIAKQDAWISMLLGGVIGVALTILVVHLSTLHPNQSLVQFSRGLLGKWLGRFIVLPCIIAWYILSVILVRSFADFIHLILLNRTPIWIIMLILVAIMTYLSYSSGITGIGRFCELVGPIIILTLVVCFILNLQNIEWQHLLPVYYDTGWKNILIGSIGPAFWFPGPFVLLVIISFMQDTKKAIPMSLLGVCIAIFTVFTATLIVVMVFGPNLAEKFRFSFFASVRTIDILNFIQNADIVITFIWVFGVIAQLSLYFFIGSYELANLFEMKDWRKTSWFGALVIFILASFIPDEAIIVAFDKFWTSVAFPICGIVIPLILWISTIVKTKSSESKV